MNEFIKLILPFFKFLWKNKIFLFIIYGVILTGLLSYGYKKYKDLETEANRYKNNQEALIKDVETYKTESGKNAAKVTQLELTTGEFKKLCSDQLSTIDDLNLKVKNLESVSTTVTESNVTGNTVLRDTILLTRVLKGDTVTLTNEKVYYDTITKQQYVYVPDTVKYFKWNDAWNSIEGKIRNNDVECTYHGIDTLTIAATKIKKKFLFFRWGCKYIEVNLVNQNPYNKVIYNRTIKFKN